MRSAVSLILAVYLEIVIDVWENSLMVCWRLAGKAEELLIFVVDNFEGLGH
jgi:hypothetical protein